LRSFDPYLPRLCFVFLPAPLRIREESDAKLFEKRGYCCPFLLHVLRTLIEATVE